MNRETLDWTLREFIRYIFRSPTFESRLLRTCSVLLLAIVSGSWAFGFTSSSGTKVDVSSANFIPDWLVYSIAALCVVGIIISVWMGWTRFARETLSLSRKKVLVIEGRGLRDDDGSPLLAAVPDTIVGHRIPIGLDLRQRRDGIVQDPEMLLPEVEVMRRSMRQHASNNDREDLTIVYGGLTPVPFTFLTGVSLDDEGTIVTMDWDRTQEKWRRLDAEDDGVRFEVEGLEALGGSQEVVLAVSASYSVLAENIATNFQVPVVKMTLPDLSSSHWSQAKQSALAEQFLNVAKSLEGKGVKVIHLILAAQNSVAFNLGRRYDKRNLPSLIVYQFERNDAKKYSWGVKMPVSGLRAPELVRN